MEVPGFERRQRNRDIVWLIGGHELLATLELVAGVGTFARLIMRHLFTVRAPDIA